MSIRPRVDFAFLWLVVILSCIVPHGAIAEGDGLPAGPGWRKTTINGNSQFEACGVADFNGDGKLDIFSGDSWYEAPHWTRHKVRTVPASPNPHYFEDFADCPLDCNGDGRPDIVTCTYFGRRVGWVENSGGDATAPWTEHEIDLAGSSEAGDLADINGDGRPDFLPNITSGNVAWYELAEQKPKVIWKKHVLGSQGAGHGVGLGDIDGDGRLDVITPKGWYQQPAKPAERWVFHPEFDLGQPGVFILGRDVNGDKRTDIVWGMGHNYGLYWLEQSHDASGQRVWTKRTIDDTFSQVHTQLWADLDGSGAAQFVTGKRIYAHETEPGATDKPCLYSFKFDREANGGPGSWRRSVIFEGRPAEAAPPKAVDRWALKDFVPGSAGTGLQISAIDIRGDGHLALVCPGKSGLYLFEQLRK